MRTKAQSFPTAVVGDVSTCKVNRGVKQKTQSAYNWCAEIPGDMHAKGFLCEAAFKAHSKRETVWVVLLLVIAQLRFKNYCTESLGHVVNVTSLWPLAFSEMLRQTASVNLTRKNRRNIDLNEYVETYIVQPLKNYATGHL